jgi:hypothetical protein
MSDIEARLAGLDPAANQPYHHADLDAMITRIVTTPEPARSTRWQLFQARLGFGAIAATLAAALTLVATQGAPSLPALAIARALATPSANLATGAPMATYEDVHFSAGPAISSSAPSIASYELKLPANPKTEIVRLAKVFDVTGTLYDQSGFTIASTSGATIAYEDTDVPQWYYSSRSPKVAPAEKSGSVSVAMPSHTALESDVRRYVSQLGFNFTLSSPRFSTATTSTTTAAGTPLTVSSETASYSVVVDGQATDESISFTFNPANTLLFAEGPAFRVRSGVSYPLLSPLAGVVALNSAEAHSFAATAKPPKATATVTSETVSLATYELKNGTLWLLPLYTYAGSVAPANGEAQLRNWSELAVEPSYVAESTGASPSISN